MYVCIFFLISLFISGKFYRDGEEVCTVFLQGEYSREEDREEFSTW